MSILGINQNRPGELVKKAVQIFYLAALFTLPFSKALFETLFSLTVITWILSQISDRTFLTRNRTLLMILALFVISSSMSAFTSGYPIASIRGIIKLLKYIFILMITVDLFRNPTKMKHLVTIGLSCLILVLVDAAIQEVTGKDIIAGIPVQFTSQRIRITGPFISYGLFAAFLISMLPITLTIFYSKAASQTWQRLLLAFLFLLGLYFLYKTHSRGAWLAAFGSWVIFALITRNKILVVILFLILLIAPWVVPRNVLIHLDLQRREQSLVERYHLWNRALQVIQVRPLFGCGINTFTLNYSKFDKRKNWRVKDYPVHNGYLQLAAETGLISLLLFLIILWRSLNAGYLTFRREAGQKKFLVAGLITGLLALLFQAGVDTTLHNIQSAVLIWLFIGLLIAVEAMTRKANVH